MDFRLNLPGPLNFTDESPLLHVELDSLTWLQWIVEGNPEAMVRQITYHHRAVNRFAALTGKRVNCHFGDAESITPFELAVDVCVCGTIARFALTFAVRGQCVGHRIIPKRLNATSLAQLLKSSPESACRLESQFGLFQLCGRGQAPMRNVE